MGREYRGIACIYESMRVLYCSEFVFFFGYILVLRYSRMHFHLQVRPEDEGSFSGTLSRVYQSTRLHFPGDCDLEVCLVL